MERKSVRSSNIRSIGYDDESAVLEVEFTSRSIYQYYGVPAGVYLALMASFSKGRCLGAHIKDRYRYRQLR